MGLENLGPIAQYNSLTDPYLQGYYSKRIVRNHLKQTGLINRRGEIIPEEIWRKRIATKERMEQASRIIANRIVQQAIEIKNLEKAELRRKVDVITKKELVRRIRGKSAEDRNPPKLWPDLENAEDGYGPHKKNNNLISSTMRHEDLNAIRVLEDDEDYSRRYQTYIRKSRSKPKKRSKSKNKFEFKRSFSVYPKPEPVSITVTMLYYGKGINIPFDTQVFDPKDEITVYQQHCGGENLIVFSGLVEDGSKFRFISKRHRQYPFSLTIFINGTYDCRISTCCEYKHRLNARIGGPTGRFAITNVVGDNPCLKCLIERANDEKKAAKSKKNQKEDIQVITEKRHESYDGSASGTNEIQVEHDASKARNEDSYDSEFEQEPERDAKSQSWIVRVYTSDLESEGFEGTDAKVYIHLMDDKNETEKIWLNKSNAKSTSKDLFETGATNEFAISTNTPIKRLNKIRIGHDNSGFASGWHLKKVEIINKSNASERYVFDCNSWLDKDEGDGKIERILRAASNDDDLDDDQKATIEIPVRHLSDSDSDEDRKVSSRIGSDRKDKDSRKSSWSTVSLSSRGNETKSKRLTNDDVIAQIKRIDDAKSPKSTSRSTDSSITTNSIRSEQKETADTKRSVSKQSFMSTSSQRSVTKVQKTTKITTKKDSFDFSSEDDFASPKGDSKKNNRNENETAKIRKSSFSSRNSVESPKLKNSSSSKKSSTHSIGSLKTPSLSKIQTVDKKSSSQIGEKVASTSKDSIGFDRVKSPSSKSATPTKREAAKQLERQLSKSSNKTSSRSTTSSSDDEDSLFNSSINRVNANQTTKKPENSSRNESRNSGRASVNKKEMESSRVATPKENGSVKNVDLAGIKSKSPSLNLTGKITSTSTDSEEEAPAKATKNEATSSKHSLKNDIGKERPASAKSTSSSSSSTTSSSSKPSSTDRTPKVEYKSSESTIPKVKITASSDVERASSRENAEKRANDMDDSTDSWK